jgi:hypothetical protein
VITVALIVALCGFAGVVGLKASGKTSKIENWVLRFMKRASIDFAQN